MWSNTRSTISRCVKSHARQMATRAKPARRTASTAGPVPTPPANAITTSAELNAHIFAAKHRTRDARVAASKLMQVVSTYGEQLHLWNGGVLLRLFGSVAALQSTHRIVLFSARDMEQLASLVLRVAQHAQHSGSLHATLPVSTLAGLARCGAELGISASSSVGQAFWAKVLQGSVPWLAQVQSAARGAAGAGGAHSWQRFHQQHKRVLHILAIASAANLALSAGIFLYGEGQRVQPGTSAVLAARAHSGSQPAAPVQAAGAGGREHWGTNQMFPTAYFDMLEAHQASPAQRKLLSSAEADAWGDEHVAAVVDIVCALRSVCASTPTGACLDGAALQECVQHALAATAESRSPGVASPHALAALSQATFAMAAPALIAGAERVSSAALADIADTAAAMAASVAGQAATNQAAAAMATIAAAVSEAVGTSLLARAKPGAGTEHEAPSPAELARAAHACTKQGAQLVTAMPGVAAATHAELCPQQCLPSQAAFPAEWHCLQRTGAALQQAALGALRSAPAVCTDGASMETACESLTAVQHALRARAHLVPGPARGALTSAATAMDVLATVAAALPAAQTRKAGVSSVSSILADIAPLCAMPAAPTQAAAFSDSEDEPDSATSHDVRRAAIPVFNAAAHAAARAMRCTWPVSKEVAAAPVRRFAGATAPNRDPLPVQAGVLRSSWDVSSVASVLQALARAGPNRESDHLAAATLLAACADALAWAAQTQRLPEAGTWRDAQGQWSALLAAAELADSYARAADADIVPQATAEAVRQHAIAVWKAGLVTKGDARPARAALQQQVQAPVSPAVVVDAKRQARHGGASGRERAASALAAQLWSSSPSASVAASALGVPTSVLRNSSYLNTGKLSVPAAAQAKLDLAGAWADNFQDMSDKLAAAARVGVLTADADADVLSGAGIALLRQWATMRHACDIGALSSEPRLHSGLTRSLAAAEHAMQQVLQAAGHARISGSGVRLQPWLAAELSSVQRLLAGLPLSAGIAPSGRADAGAAMASSSAALLGQVTQQQQQQQQVAAWSSAALPRGPGAVPAPVHAMRASAHAYVARP